MTVQAQEWKPGAWKGILSLVSSSSLKRKTFLYDQQEAEVDFAPREVPVMFQCPQDFCQRFFYSRSLVCTKFNPYTSHYFVRQRARKRLHKSVFDSIRQRTDDLFCEHGLEECSLSSELFPTSESSFALSYCSLRSLAPFAFQRSTMFRTNEEELMYFFLGSEEIQPLIHVQTWSSCY